MKYAVEIELTDDEAGWLKDWASPQNHRAGAVLRKLSRALTSTYHIKSNPRNGGSPAGVRMSPMHQLPREE